MKHGSGDASIVARLIPTLRDCGYEAEADNGFVRPTNYGQIRARLDYYQGWIRIGFNRVTPGRDDSIPQYVLAHEVPAMPEWFRSDTSELADTVGDRMAQQFLRQRPDEQLRHTSRADNGLRPPTILITDGAAEIVFTPQVAVEIGEAIDEFFRNLQTALPGESTTRTEQTIVVSLGSISADRLKNVVANWWRTIEE